MASNIDQVLAGVPHQHRGPGGSAAVIKDGKLLGYRVWGYANLDARAPMTPSTLLPICSISKQMVCLAAVSLAKTPTQSMLLKHADPWQLMDEELKKLLPHLDGITMSDLWNMQSGIRDYWCLTTLWGAKPDGVFDILSDGPKALDRTKSLHFKTGAEKSYCNVNFYVVGRILENVSGMSLNELLTERVFVPAGMRTAYLYIDSNRLPQPVVGYEGNEKVGFFAAENRIQWAGDAGIACSLNDMIAYEKWLQTTYSDSSSLYHQTSQQQFYKDGREAEYGFGLMRDVVAGRGGIRHGGALRGFRLSRCHFPAENISIVVTLNHEGDAGGASNDIFKRMLGVQDPKPSPATAIKPVATWAGDYFDDDTSLYLNARIPADKPGKIEVQYRFTHETFPLLSETTAGHEHVKISLEGDVLVMNRIDDNRVLRARRIKKPSDAELHNARSSDYLGAYRCEEIESTFHCTGGDGTLYGSFDGYLGSGPIWLMRYLGEDIWVLGNPRGMDASPPGDWTVVFGRDDKGAVDRVSLGCNLARHVKYLRV